MQHIKQAVGKYFSHLCCVADTENYAQDEVESFVMGDEQNVADDPGQTKHHSQRKAVQKLLPQRSLS